MRKVHRKQLRSNIQYASENTDSISKWLICRDRYQYYVKPTADEYPLLLDAEYRRYVSTQRLTVEIPENLLKKK